MKKKQLLKAFLAAAFTISFSMASFAAEWVQEGDKWWYRLDDGSYPSGIMYNIGGNSYWFGADGYMMSDGWIKANNGNWYYANEDGVVQKNTWIDGTYYVGSDGVLLINATTPDGYYVGADGKWDGGASQGSNSANSAARQTTGQQGENTLTGIINGEQITAQVTGMEKRKGSKSDWDGFYLTSYDSSGAKQYEFKLVFYFPIKEKKYELDEEHIKIDVARYENGYKMEEYSSQAWKVKKKDVKGSVIVEYVGNEDVTDGKTYKGTIEGTIYPYVNKNKKRDVEAIFDSFEIEDCTFSLKMQAGEYISKESSTGSGSGSDDSLASYYSLLNDGSSSTTSYKVDHTCSTCNGTGLCGGCAGRGQKYYSNGKAHDCYRCHGSGRCQSCHGSGKIY